MRAQETDGAERKDETGAIKPANLFGFSERKKKQVEGTVCELLEKTFGWIVACNTKTNVEKCVAWRFNI